MNRYRHKLLWGAALLCLVLLFVGGPGALSLRSYRYAWGAGHLLCFALWGYLYSLYRQQCHFKRLAAEMLLLTIIVGGGTELLQALVGREASWLDLVNDIIGALFGLLFLSAARMQLSWPRRLLLSFPVVLLLVWSLSPVARVVADDLVARSQFPLLSDFETSLEVSRWSGSAGRSISGRVAFSGSHSLEVHLGTQRYSGIGLREFPRDWSGYRVVSMQIYNPDSEPLDLHFRIHDGQHDYTYGDRYNRSFVIKPQWNHLVVSLDRVAEGPKRRKLDLSEVAGMLFFVGKLDRVRTIYIDDVRLLP